MYDYVEIYMNGIIKDGFCDVGDFFSLFPELSIVIRNSNSEEILWKGRFGRTAEFEVEEDMTDIYFEVYNPDGAYLPQWKCSDTVEAGHSYQIGCTINTTGTLLKKSLFHVYLTELQTDYEDDDDYDDEDYYD